MSERGIVDFLFDIIEAINRIQEYILGLDYHAFMTDLKTRDAVIRNIEIIGEAAKNITKDFRNKYPDVPWKEMSGMRDKLIHHYFGVNLEIVWTISNEELSGIKDIIESIIKFESA